MSCSMCSITNTEMLVLITGSSQVVVLTAIQLLILLPWNSKLLTKGLEGLFFNNHNWGRIVKKAAIRTRRHPYAVLACI